MFVTNKQNQQMYEARELTIHLFSMLCFLDIENQVVAITYLSGRVVNIEMMEDKINAYNQRCYPNYIIGQHEKVY